MYVDLRRWDLCLSFYDSDTGAQQTWSPLLSVYNVPATAGSAVHELSHLILTVTLGGAVAEEAETQKG